MAQLVKTALGLPIASVKTALGLAIASVKTMLGLDNTSGGGGSTVTIDTVGTRATGISGQTSPKTVSISVGSGTDRFIMAYWGAGDATLADRTLDAVSSNLDGAFTHLTSGAGDDGNFCATDLWYLKNPTTGTHTITYDWGVSAVVDAYYLECISYTGVNQTTPVGSAIVVNGTVASIAPTTGAITIGTGEMATAVICTDSETLSIVTGTSRDLLQNLGSDQSVGVATLAATGAIAWSQASNKYAISAVVIKPS